MSKYLNEEGVKELLKSIAVPKRIDSNEVMDARGSYPTLNDRLDNMGDGIDIKKLGAKGNGVDDDTNVFKEALKTYKKIYVPKGKYKITDTLFIPENTTLYGYKNNSFHNGYNDGSTLLFDSQDKSFPCISFLGRKNGENVKNVYVTNGQQIDNGVYTSTVSSELININLVSTSGHNVGVIFSGAAKSIIRNVSCYDFLLGFVVSANWGSQIKNCYSKCCNGIYVSTDTNNLDIDNCYIEHTAKYTVTEDNTLLYSLLTNDNLRYENKPSGIMAIWDTNLHIENTVCEHFEIGINLGAHSHALLNNVWLENDILPLSTYTGNVEINKVFMVKANKGGDYAIRHCGTHLKINSCASDYKHLINEEDTTRYANISIENVSDNEWYINNYSTLDCNIIYFDSVNGREYGIGTSKDPISNFSRALSRINDGGTIYFLNDYTLETNGDYITLSKNITFESSKSNKKTLKNKDANRILPIRFLKNLTFKNINIDVSLTAENATEPSLSYLLNPYNSSYKTVTFENCDINTKGNYGLLGAYYNANTFCNINIVNCNFTGSCRLSNNRTSGSNKKFYANLNISGLTKESDLVIESQTEIVARYEN